jgi:hypothetical protein
MGPIEGNCPHGNYRPSCKRCRPSSIGGAGKHRRCPVYTPSCNCAEPSPVFYVCCGYWCSICKGKSSA